MISYYNKVINFVVDVLVVVSLNIFGLMIKLMIMIKQMKTSHNLNQGTNIGVTIIGINDIN